MSILLEALKKSERQRQLGQTPTLETPTGGQSSPPGAASRWIPIALLTLSAFAITWFGWQQFSEPESVAGPGTVAEVAQTSEQALAQAGPEASPPAAEDSGDQTAPGQLAARSRGKDREKLNRSFSEYQAESQDEMPAEQRGIPEKNSGAARRQVARRTPQEIDENPPQKAGQPPSRPVDQPDAKQPGPGSDTTEPARSKVQPHIAEPISYWALPQGVRDTLPEIRITVLVFAENPGDRFLLANGQRLVEKEELESGVVLDEIRRDGAVFLYRNYRFLVKG